MHDAMIRVPNFNHREMSFPLPPKYIFTQQLGFVCLKAFTGKRVCNELVNKHSLEIELVR